MDACLGIRFPFVVALFIKGNRGGEGVREKYDVEMEKGDVLYDTLHSLETGDGGGDCEG